MSEISHDDLDLMRRIRERDQQALSSLYNRYGNAVYSLALRILQNKELAEEITQDIYLRVWERSNQWDPAKGKLISWLLTLTRYASIDLIRKQNRRPKLVESPVEELMDQPVSLSVVDDPMWQNGQILRDLMTQLPTEQAQVVQLAFFQGMTHSELSATLSLPLGTVKTRIRSGLQRLRKLWFEVMDEESNVNSI